MLFYSRTCAIRRNALGVTLLEVLVTLALIAITATWVWPRFTTFSEQSDVIRLQHQWESVVAFARLHALETGREVFICPSADGVHCAQDWSLGWLVSTDEGDPLLIVKPLLNHAQWRGRVVPVKPTRVFFDESGQSSSGSFWLCLPRERTPALAWHLSRWGRLTRLTPLDASAFPCEAG